MSDAQIALAAAESSAASASSASTAADGAAESLADAVTARAAAETAKTQAETARTAAQAAAAAAGAQMWVGGEAVTTATVRQAPDGSRIKSTAARTTRATFDATEQGFWTPVLSTAGTLEQVALSATIETGVEPTRLRTATIKPRIVTLVSGQVDQPVTTANSCTTSADTANYKIGSQGLKMTIAAATTAYVYFDPVVPNADPLTFPPASQVYLWVYIPDATKVTGLDVEIKGSADLAAGSTWTRSLFNAADTVLEDGWNLLRWKASAGTLSGWGTAYRVRVIVYTNAATTVTLGHLWVECPPKAQLVMVLDRGYKTWTDYALAAWRAKGWPLVWALDPALNGTSAGTKNEVITDAQVAQFFAAGDEINVHSYDGSTTSAMTSDQLVTDWMQAARWLQQHGYPVPLFRAAFTQNLATNHAALQGFLLGYATPTAASGHECWPPVNRYNIGRYGIHGRTDATIDAQFDTLQATNGLLVAYTHGVHADGITNGGADMTPAGWDYFFAKVEAAVDAGWLEIVTFEDLFARAGGRFSQGLGHARAELVDPNGDIILQELM